MNVRMTNLKSTETRYVVMMLNVMQFHVTTSL